MIKEKLKALHIAMDYIANPPETKECLWPGCAKRVQPAMWGCPEHWLRLPKRLRSMIWSAYKPSDDNWRESRAYLRIAHIIDLWIKENAK